MKKTIWILLISILTFIPFIKETKVIQKLKLISDHQIISTLHSKDQKYYAVQT